jgi:hypothetical protein
MPRYTFRYPVNITCQRTVEAPTVDWAVKMISEDDDIEVIRGSIESLYSIDIENEDLIEVDGKPTEKRKGLNNEQRYND